MERARVKMSSSEENKKNREEILGKIRNTIKKNKINTSSREVNQKMKKEINFASNTNLFISKLEKVGATIKVIKDESELVKEVNRYVVEKQIKSTITVPENSSLNKLDWEDVKVDSQLAPLAITVSVTRAWMGIEETGTLVLRSSLESPTSLNFLPDHHLVVINANDIVKTMEDVFTELRKNINEIPRTINLITGPSRTADIEQEIQIGAHGPRCLHVVIVDNS